MITIRTLQTHGRIVNILKNGVIAWNRWKKKHDDKRPSHDISKILLTISAAGENFRGVDFSEVHLSLSDLSNANFDGADLRGADIIGTDLREANLTGAILMGARLHDAKLAGADLSGAIFGNTSITDCDLSETKGLETASHRGHSSIDITTLYRSKGRIPESFLRGCGLPEEFIRYVPSFVNNPIQFYSCFISYSHEDKTFARLLHDRLQGHGIRCWLDEHQLLPGDDLHDSIDRGVRFWDKVLLCASKSSLSSWWVNGEINRAFQKEAQIMKERGKKVLALIPLNLDGFLFSNDYRSGKKSEITSRVAANFVGWDKDLARFDCELAKVIRALRTNESGRETPPATKL